MKTLKTSTIMLSVLGFSLTLMAVPSVAKPKAQAKASRPVASVSKPIALTEQEMAQTTGTDFGEGTGFTGQEFGEFVVRFGGRVIARQGGRFFAEFVSTYAQTNAPNGPAQ